MAHFAYVVNGTVEKVHVVANAVITDGDGVEQESLGQAFLSDLHGYPAGSLVQCSYNGNFRGVYPSKDFTYDEASDAFIRPMPEDGEYVWDEQAGDWVEVTE